LRRWLGLGGALVVLAAVVWWGLVFRKVVSFDYLSLPQAGVCLALDNGICELAMSLCSSRVKHFLDITRYSPHLLWIGLALLSASLSLEPRAPAGSAAD
jgi:hypothetical protein